MIYPPGHDPWLPDWCQGAVACQYEGHDYGYGNVCRRCGDRLRCHLCGRFVRIDTCEEHICQAHGDLIEEEQ